MKLFSLIKKDLLILLRDRLEMAVLFLMPLAFIIPISLALGDGDGYGITSGNRMMTLTVADYDRGPGSQMLLTAIGESLRIEKTIDPALLASLGLSGEPACAFESAAQPQDSALLFVPVTAAEAQTTAEPYPAPEQDAEPQPTEQPDTAAPYPAPDQQDTEPQPAPEQQDTAAPYPPAAAPATEEAAQTDSAPQNPSAEAKTETIVAVEAPECLEIAGREMLARSWRPALLIIPKGFTQAVEAGQPVETLLFIDPAGDPAQAQQIEGVVKGATIKLSLQNRVERGFGQLNQMLALASEPVRQAVAEQAAEPPPAEQKPAVRLEKTFPANYRQPAFPDTYQQTISGYTVMYVFFIITSLASSIRGERLNGTFRRLLSMPVSRSELLGGKLFAAMIVGLVQVFLLFGAGALLFGLRLGNDPLAFFLLTVVLVAAATALGLAAATTRLSGGALVAPLVIAALLGGSMFPLDLMPPFLRAVSLIIPHRWALTGYQNLMVRGLGLQEVFPQIAVLAAFALLFFLIAVLRFDFESQEAD